MIDRSITYKKKIGRRAITPMIASFVIISITVTLSLVTAYFIPLATGEYTDLEKLEIINARCTKENDIWTIQINMKNTGTTTISLIGCYINNLEVDQYGEDDPIENEWVTNMENGIKKVPKNARVPMKKIFGPSQIESGQTIAVLVFIDSNKPESTLSSGTKANIKIRSASGMEYIILIRLV
jgi:hypothetical protein